MNDKRKYVVSLMNSVNECVFSNVVSSCSATDAVFSFFMTVLSSVGSDVFSRFVDGKFSVSCCPFDVSDFLGGY